MSEQFIGASIQPVSETIDAGRMNIGEPGLPREFRWNDELLRIDRVLRKWRETGDCRHGSGERYVRKHWFEVVTVSGQRLKIYFERQGRPGQKTNRWRLYTMDDGRAIP